MGERSYHYGEMPRSLFSGVVAYFNGLLPAALMIGGTHV
jgi:hypothetical protein